MACAFAWNGGGSIPRFACYDDWKPFLSTKMDVAARIIQHHLARDDAPNVTFEDGKAVFPRPSSTPGATQTMKIVIFQLFPSLRGPLSQVSSFLPVAKSIIDLSYKCLELYGIKSLAIDGAKSYKARASTVARFKKSKTCRVLIISSVGSAGLNLAFCSCVIYIVRPSGHHLANTLMLSWTGSNLELPGRASDRWSCMAATPGQRSKNLPHPRRPNVRYYVVGDGEHKTRYARGLPRQGRWQR